MKHAANPEIAGLLVDVYLNLHRPGFLSIRAAEGPDKGRVIGYSTAIELEGCQFRVSEAGRQRVLRERRKNVHATVRGRVVQVCTEASPSPRLVSKAHQALAGGAKDVTYNPYFTPLFIHRQTKEPVHTAASVIVIGKHVAATGA